VYHVKDTFTGKPTIYLYDSVPGGIGLSDRVFEMDHELLERARDLLLGCKCVDGCPGCVGAAAGRGAKFTLIQILNRILGTK
jgi:DEAD/DEAH box helicase domain-containing protein